MEIVPNAKKGAGNVIWHWSNHFYAFYHARVVNAYQL